jgi:hypothetical protein
LFFWVIMLPDFFIFLVILCWILHIWWISYLYHSYKWLSVETAFSWRCGLGCRFVKFCWLWFHSGTIVYFFGCNWWFEAWCLCR